MLTAPFVFISSEEKQTSFFQAGKVQISFAKKHIPCFSRISSVVYLHIFVVLWGLSRSSSAENHKARLAFLFLEWQLYLRDVHPVQGPAQSPCKTWHQRFRLTAFLCTEDERAALLSFSLKSYPKKRQRKTFARLAFSTETCKAEIKTINSFQSGN